LLLASCEEEPPQPPYCTGPDFQILVTALDIPLPPDTVVHVEYGGTQVDEYWITDDPVGPEVAFCEESDREGNPVSGAGGDRGGSSNATGMTGEGGAGGAPSGGTMEGLICDLWTDGPATVTILTSVFPTVEVPLRAKKGKCTVWKEIEIGPDDGGP